MKKYLSVLIAAMLAVSCLCACGGSGAPSSPSDSGKGNQKQLKIVASIFPAYDWVKEILGSDADQAEITLLLDQDADLHNYQPSAEDIAKISDCDLFLYVGGESDGWVDGALRKAANKNRKTVNLMEVLGKSAKEEELAEGMEEEDAHEDEAHEHGEEGKPEYDEHVWLSLKNARLFCGAIANALAELDPEHASVYQTNAKSYAGRLTNLDQQYQDAVKSSPRKTLLFGDRFPFRYLADDYGLSYYAAFKGCSAETEASFKTIAFLARKVDKLGLNSVLTIEKSDQKIAKTIIKNTQKKNQKIRALDSMQSTTSKEVSKGITYLSVMERNLRVMKEALR